MSLCLPAYRLTARPNRLTDPESSEISENTYALAGPTEKEF